VTIIFQDGKRIFSSVRTFLAFEIWTFFLSIFKKLKHFSNLFFRLFLPFKLFWQYIYENNLKNRNILYENNLKNRNILYENNLKNRNILYENNLKRELLILYKMYLKCRTYTTISHQLPCNLILLWERYFMDGLRL